MPQLAVQLVDVARELMRAHRGDEQAPARAFKAGAPLLADLMRPGAGLFVSRGLELLDEYRAYEDGRQLTAAPAEDDPRDESHPMDRFVKRLLARKFGFYVIAGDPDKGKTTLALRLASRLNEERGYQVISVGGLHPDDRDKWRTQDWVQAEHPARFAEAMGQLADATLEEDVQYPPSIKRRVILLDDASLTAHVSQAGMTRALMRCWNVYRHLDWVVILTARTFKSITTVAESADARFLKRPVWDSLRTEREHAREWWENADRAFAEIRRSDWWQAFPSEKQWVYVESESLKFHGMLRYSVPTATRSSEVED